MRHAALATIAALLATFVIASNAIAAPPADAGVQMIEVENYVGAQAYFEALLRKHPGDANAATGMAKLQLAEGRNQPAVTWAKRAVAAAPDCVECQLVLGYAYSRYIHDVGLFHKIGIAHKILAAFRQGVALAPTNADAHADLASFYIHAPGIVGGSLAKARKQIALLAPLDAVRANALLAEIAAKRKHMAQAKRDMLAAVNADASGNGDFYLGQFLVAQGQLAEGLAAFEAGIHANPANSRNYYQAGRVAALTQAHVPEGIRNLQKYLTMPHRWQASRASYKWARYQLGRLYGLAGDRAAAAAQYRAALALDPGFSQPRLALAAM